MTCTADLAAPGLLEVELGDQLRRLAGGVLGDVTPFLIKVPLAHWIEIQLGGNGYAVTPDADYFDDIVVGAKLHLADQTARAPALAVTAAASIPTAAQTGYTRTYDLLLTAHASKDVRRVHFDLNVGFDVFELGGPRSYQPWIALAASLPITSRVSVTLEPHYFADAAPIARRDAGAIGAVAFALRSWIVIDGAIEVIGWDQRSVSALAGVSIAPVRLWGPHA